MSSMVVGMTGVKRRPYSSAIRRGDAPALVRAAARRLFMAKGYLATSIDDIAAEAGVARPTVYAAGGSKSAILKSVVDEALAGDDLPVAVAERPWYREAVTEPDPHAALRLHVRNISGIQQRFALLLRALESAASTDRDASALLEQVRRQRRAGLAAIAADLASKATLRCDEQQLADVLYALPPDAYVRLVHEGGWSDEAFEHWLADALERICLP